MWVYQSIHVISTYKLVESCFSTYRQRFVSSISPLAVFINSIVRFDSNDRAVSWQPVVNTNTLYSPAETSVSTQFLYVENQGQVKYFIQPLKCTCSHLGLNILA